MMQDKKDKIVIGVDFGTTFSGIAWAESQHSDIRTAIERWPTDRVTLEGESSKKVPTKIRYTDQATEWGFSIAPTASKDEVCEWFKMRLDPTQSQNFEGFRSFQHLDRPADQLTKDFLANLAEHACYMLGNQFGESLIKDAGVEIVLTIPAIWSDLARDRTFRAAQQAFQIFGSSWGQTPIRLISEPEAAATYALHTMNSHLLSAGDAIVVMDAGGGTVDLISYTIKELRPLRVEEAAPGSGACCGSTYLNSRFADLIRSILGKQKAFDDEILKEAVEYFEKTVKRKMTMRTPPEQIFNIPVHGITDNKQLCVKRGHLQLKASEILKVFDPVIRDCIKLAKDQVSSCGGDVNAILLVGGFGESVFLKEKLQDAFGKSIRILQPGNAWQAVVQGAVMQGFMKVDSRKARKHHGLLLGRHYDKCNPEHRGIPREWDDFSGQETVYCMDWHVKKGDVVSEDEPFLIDYFSTELVSDGRIENSDIEIYVDTLDRADNVKYVDQIRKLCRLEADLSGIPETAFTKRMGKDKKWYYYLDFQVEVTYRSASTEYTLLHEGKRYDTVSVEYV